MRLSLTPAALSTLHCATGTKRQMAKIKPQQELHMAGCNILGNSTEFHVMDLEPTSSEALARAGASGVLSAAECRAAELPAKVIRCEQLPPPPGTSVATTTRGSVLAVELGLCARRLALERVLPRCRHGPASAALASISFQVA